MSNVKYLQRYKDCAEYGFDLTSMPAMKWFEMLKRYDMQYTNRKRDGSSSVGTGDGRQGGAFVWGFRDGHIVTGSSAGEHREPEQGYAGYIGITGTRAFVRKVKAYIRKHAECIKDEAPSRQFI